MRHRLRRHLGWRDLVVVATAILLGVILGLVIWAGHRRDRQIDGLSTALAAQRQQAAASGQTPVARAPDQVRQNPERPTVKPVPGPSGPKGDKGDGPTDAQVHAAVLAAIQAHPDWIREGIDPARLGAFVANYLHEHPPEPGKPPSAEQLHAAILAVLAEHPPSPGPAGSPGPKGDRGEKGRGPTAQELADAVASWIHDHPLPRCPDGTQAEAHSVVVDDDGNPLTRDTVDAVICVKAG